MKKLVLKAFTLLLVLSSIWGCKETTTTGNDDEILGSIQVVGKNICILDKDGKQLECEYKNANPVVLRFDDKNEPHLMQIPGALRLCEVDRNIVDDLTVAKNADDIEMLLKKSSLEVRRKSDQRKFSVPRSPGKEVMLYEAATKDFLAISKMPGTNWETIEITFDNVAGEIVMDDIDEAGTPYTIETSEAGECVYFGECGEAGSGIKVLEEIGTGVVLDNIGIDCDVLALRIFQGIEAGRPASSMKNNALDSTPRLDVKTPPKVDIKPASKPKIGGSDLASQLGLPTANDKKDAPSGDMKTKSVTSDGNCIEDDVDQWHEHYDLPAGSTSIFLVNRKKLEIPGGPLGCPAVLDLEKCNVKVCIEGDRVKVYLAEADCTQCG